MRNLWMALSNSLIFWMAWILIPFLMEIIPALFGFFLLIKKRFFTKHTELEVGRLPEITLIIPIYNSAPTLYGCLQSVYESTYPNEKISIMLVNNKSQDNSFEIFTQCQKEMEELSMQWLNARQGKSKALNMALFNAQGKYIIHIDSDGKLEQNALKNMVLRFEQNEDIHCMTGSILVEPDLIENTDSFLMKLIRRCEFCEYGQAFLAGRNYESELDSVFTLSGAFSAFRKSTILKTQLYNTDTVCEDTHVTFQVRKMLKKKVHLCENALFFVDPIEDMNKMYTQRQRWQRGELEVMHMFLSKEMKVAKGFLSNFMVRLLIFDHTFAFPRMIWYFALICLVFLNYPMKLVVGSVLLIYLLYVFSSFLFFLNILSYLREFKDIYQYYRGKWYICLLMPLYNFLIFWIRFAGIINSINSSSAWRTRNFTQECQCFRDIVKDDFLFIIKIVEKLRKVSNDETKD